MSSALFGRITIPDSVTNTGDYVFEYCSGLRKVTLFQRLNG